MKNHARGQTHSYLKNQTRIFGRQSCPCASPMSLNTSLSIPICFTDIIRSKGNATFDATGDMFSPGVFALAPLSGADHGPAFIEGASSPPFPYTCDYPNGRRWTRGTRTRRRKIRGGGRKTIKLFVRRGLVGGIALPPVHPHMPLIGGAPNQSLPIRDCKEGATVKDGRDNRKRTLRTYGRRSEKAVGCWGIEAQGGRALAGGGQD